MSGRFDIARLLAAFVCAFITIATANAQVLIQHQGTTYKTQSDMFAPLAEVVVGAADVRIGGFGVYGQTSVAANVKWVIFDSLVPQSPAFLSSAHTVSGAPGSFATQARWYDSPAMDMTLQANHRYAIGILSDTLGASGFRWGASVTANRYAGGGPATSDNGLSAPFSAALANAGLAGSFYSTPRVYTFSKTDPLEWNNAIRPSLRIMAPVPEPREWALLIAGLTLIGWVSRRRGRFP